MNKTEISVKRQGNQEETKKKKLELNSTTTEIKNLLEGFKAD